MERLKIKIKPLFVVYVFLCMYFGWYNDIFFYVVTLILHEYGHYIATIKLGYKVDGLIFALYGSALKTSNCYKPKDEIIIAISGPMVNIVIILFLLASWWLFPSLYLFTKPFLMANLLVLIFNMLPIYPLDGGRIMLSYLSKKIPRTRLERTSQKVCVVLGVILLLLFVYSIFIAINYSLLFIGGFLVLNGVASSQSAYNSVVKTFSKTYSKPIEVKVFKVDEIQKKQLIKYLSPHYYSIFEVGEGTKKTRIEEKDLFE